MTRRPRRPFGFAIAIAVLAGCGATIVRSPKDGGPIYGKIVGNGETRMYVETASGDRVGVFRTDIESIDHPGNVAAVVGGVLTLYGLYNAQLFMSPTARGDGQVAQGVAVGLTGRF